MTDVAPSSFVVNVTRYVRLMYPLPMRVTAVTAVTSRPKAAASHAALI
jgi:hypothetical protein